MGGVFQAGLPAETRHLEGLGDAAGEDGVRLKDVVTTSLDHHAQLRQPLGVKLSPRDGHPAVGPQCGLVVVGVHGQRLLDPGQAGVGGGVDKSLGPREIPDRGVGDGRHPPGLVGVHPNGHSIAHGLRSLGHLPNIYGLVEVVHPQLDGMEPLRQPGFGLLDALLGGPHLPRRRVDLDFAGLAAQQFAHRLSRQLSLDVPERGLHPPIAPAQVRHLPQTLLNHVDVGGVLPQQIRADQVSQPRPLPPHGRTGGHPDHPVVGEEPHQREAILTLRKSRNPAGPKHRRQGNFYVEQLDANDRRHGLPRANEFQKSVFASPARVTMCSPTNGPTDNATWS